MPIDMTVFPVVPLPSSPPPESPMARMRILSLFQNSGLKLKGNAPFEARNA
jgi:hypothetical protein